MIIRNVAEGGVVWVDHVFRARVGWSADALAERPLLEWIDAADRVELEAALQAGDGTVRARHAVRGGDTVALDWRVRTTERGLIALGTFVGDESDRCTPRQPRPPTAEAGDVRWEMDTLAGTLHAMAHIVEQQHPGRRCSILLLDESGEHVSVGAGPSLPPEYNAAVEGLRIGPFVGSCGTAAFWNRPVIVEDIQNEVLWRDLRQHAAGAGVAACWSHPITSPRGDVLGALALYNSVPSAPTQHELSGLGMAASMVALAIERGRAEQALRASETALRESTRLVELQSSVLASIASGVELPTTLSWLCTEMETLLPGARCMVLLLDEAGEVLDPAAGPSMPEPLLAALEGMRAETSTGTCGAAVFLERQMIVPDVEDDPAWACSLPLLRTHTIRSSWSTPLRSRGGGTLGTVSICHEFPCEPSDSHQHLMQTAAQLACIATERHRQDDALRRTQKLESLGLMAGGVAHDFNNLLVAILGQSALALDMVPEDGAPGRHIRKAVHAAERAAELTNQLLAYTGQGHFEIRPFDLNRAIQDNLHLFDVAIPKAVRVTPDLGPSLPLLDADTGQMQQVLMNLIHNAAESTGEGGGEVALRTRLRRLEANDPRYARYTNQPVEGGNYVELEVEDDGAGMDEATLARIFDPFFTTKTQGRGLGLAAVLGIVRGHNGGLSVHSEPGRGTRFSLVFPVGAVASSERAPAASIESVAMTSERVLVIDDEEVVRATIADFLTGVGIAVLMADGGREGVDLYAEHGAGIGLVILDLSMPDMSGEETLERLLAIDPDVRVLLSSGYDESEVTKRFAGKQLAGFIKKPYGPPKLIQTVLDLLGGRAPAQR